jgi:aminoglycoside phosphotransferase (APT) family kinase protein
MSDHAAIAAEWAQEWGLSEPVPVRTGMNSLFHAGDDTVIRVGPSSFGAAAEAGWVALMVANDVRVPVLHEVVDVDGECVWALERIHPAGAVAWPEVGAMVRRVHGIEPAEVAGLPLCIDFPHWQIHAVLDEVDDLVDERALGGMRRCLERWDGWRAAAAEDRVVCHGDVHPGNVVPSADGPVLLDWDLRCLAPAAWDHAALLTWSERWDGASGLYDEFATGYGRSLRGEWMAEAFAELRLLVATLMRLRAGRANPAAAAEAEVRLRYWRGDPDAPRWTPQ